MCRLCGRRTQQGVREAVDWHAHDDAVHVRPRDDQSCCTIGVQSVTQQGVIAVLQDVQLVHAAPVDMQVQVQHERCSGLTLLARAAM